jgi:hypothetical protein
MRCKALPQALNDLPGKPEEESDLLASVAG